MGIRANTVEGNEGDRKQYRAGNCNDCNRQFCLGYNLPICKGATEKDVFTTCFRECGLSFLGDCERLWVFWGYMEKLRRVLEEFGRLDHRGGLQYWQGFFTSVFERLTLEFQSRTRLEKR